MTKKKAPAKRKAKTKPVMGRPVKYRPEMCKQVIALSKEGKTITEIAVALDICRETYYQWIEEYPDFSDAHKKGRTLAQGWWEELGRECADGTKKDYSMGHYALLVSNQFGINQKSEVKTEDVTTDSLKDVPDAAIKRALAEIKKGRKKAK